MLLNWDSAIRVSFFVDCLKNETNLLRFITGMPDKNNFELLMDGTFFYVDSKMVDE